MKKVSIILFVLICLNNVFSQVEISTPEWAKNATIYEVNVRQFSPEGTFKAFQAHLPRLKKMGVDILWLMPIHPIGEKNRKGSLGSYYAVRDYKGINPEFGSMQDFKNLISEAQKLGMHVIIDWVANHTSPDNVWVDQCHQNWYTLDSAGYLQPTIGTDWWDVADLNYNNPEMRVEMIESMKFWLKEANIDGFRCDVADWVPVDFWNVARTELDKVKPVFMLAEAENPEHHKAAFDMSYGWEFHHIMNKIAKGEENVSSIHTYLKAQSKFPKEAYRMHFTSNHDENSWNGTEMERMGDARFALAVLAATFNGMPLVYNGQEASLSKRLRFFDKDTIVWNKLDLESFYTKLLNLNKTNQALWNGVHGGQIKIISSETDSNIFAFVREKNNQKVVCVFNLSKTKQNFSFNSDELVGKYTDLFSGKKVSLKSKGSMKLDPWAYKVFHL
jgi:glycosidase